jgi:hypothetical protein
MINTQINDMGNAIATGTQKMAEAQIQALELSFALFGDRAEEASKGIASAFISGFQGDQSEEEIKASIFEMLENMAIEAAIIAAGIGNKFEEIGASIAGSLADGVIDTAEISSLEGSINTIYNDAAAKIDQINKLFEGKTTSSIEARERAQEEATRLAEENLKEQERIAKEQSRIQEDALKEQERIAKEQVAVYEKTGQSFKSGIIGGLKKGDTKEEIQSSVRGMLEEMAIEAAIAAVGISDKFTEIGKTITEALSDGFFSGEELAGIESSMDSLYKQAVSTIDPIRGLFAGRDAGFTGTGASSGATVIINSPTAVDPVEASRILTNTMQSLSFQGAI